MEKTKIGYFDADHSIGGRETYENLLAMDPALFTPAAFINTNPNTNEDLNDILGGSNFLGEFDYSSGMDAGYNAWVTQGNTYCPYPNLSVDQSQYGQGLSTGAIPNSFKQSFSEQNSVEIRAIPFSDIQTSSQIGSREEPAPAASERNIKAAKSAAKRKSDTAAAPMDEATPKVKKTRGRRKTKEKSAEEKRAKEERKLERNRMAASKCRQKKKLATEEMMENFNELERQNHLMKACLEEMKQDRNNVLALLLEHKSCGQLAIDKCLESQLERIAGEFEDTQRPDTTMLRTHSLQSQMDRNTKQFLNSNPTSPSDSQTSRRNSTSIDSIAMSRSGSDTPHPHFASSPTSPSSPGYSMSRQNSSRTSVCEENGDNQRNDSGISNVDTPPEERKKDMSDSPEDEGISLASQDKAFQPRIPHMLPNQRLFGSPNTHSAMQPQLTTDPSDLKGPSAFLASLAGALP
jgi:hypothetical protein